MAGRLLWEQELACSIHATPTNCVAAQIVEGWQSGYCNGLLNRHSARDALVRIQYLPPVLRLLNSEAECRSYKAEVEISKFSASTKRMPR